MNVPGPGTYSSKSIIGNEGRPVTKMHQETTISPLLKKHESMPGPGAYEPNHKSVFNRVGAYQMGIKLKDIHADKIR